MSKILAIDIGTASVSATVAEKNNEGKFFVSDFWRLPYESSNVQNASRILFKNLKQIFKEASKFHLGTTKVVVGFAYPLCLEKTMNGEFQRENQNFSVTEQELENTVQILKNKNNIEDSRAISHDILETKINGYEVKNPLGHNGEVLDIKVNFLEISSILKNHLEELKDKFFPSSEFKCFSDSSILKKAILRFFNPKKEFAVLDIGGEVSVFENFVFPFGIRHIEKKIGSVLNRFSFGHLDYPYERNTNKILKSHADYFSGFLKEHKYNTIFLTGGGANFPVFFDALNGDSIVVKKLEARDFEKFFLKINPLSGGEDAVLAALISLN